MSYPDFQQFMDAIGTVLSDGAVVAVITGLLVAAMVGWLVGHFRKSI